MQIYEKEVANIVGYNHDAEAYCFTVYDWMQIYEKEVANIVGYNHDAEARANAPATGAARPVSVPNADALRVPHVVNVTQTFDAKCRRSYCPNAHVYFIHSVSACSDQATFMTADDLSVYLWDLERPDSSMQILNIRPEVPDETEVCSLPRDCLVW
jgi:hypothetical protein